MRIEMVLSRSVVQKKNDDIIYREKEEDIIALYIYIYYKLYITYSTNDLINYILHSAQMTLFKT